MKNNNVSEIISAIKKEYPNEKIIHETKIVNGVSVDTVGVTIYSANMLGVQVGTTGYMGGDTGHGGRTYFKLFDKGSTDIAGKVTKEPFKYSSDIEIELGGDCELYTFIKALRFAADILEAKAKDVGDPDDRA